MQHNDDSYSKTHTAKPSQVAAIEWDGEDSIPFISALGQGLDATHILNIAVHAKVPIFENPMLMEELANLHNNQNIPEHLYLAVAQILAFVRFIGDRDIR